MANRANKIESMGTKRLKHALDDANPIAISWNKYEKVLEQPSFDMHYALEFGLVLKGAIRRLYTERMDGIDYQKGDAWFSGIWEPHGFYVVEAPVELLVVVTWPPSLNATEGLPLGISLSSPFSCPLAIRPMIQDSLKPRILALAESLRECNMQKPFDRFRAKLRYQDMLSLIVEPWRGGKGRGNLEHDSSPLRMSIAPAIELVFSKPRPVSLQEGASACGMGRTKFSGLFSEMMGISYAKFGLKHRLGLAAKALIDDNMTLKDAAFKGGFTDASHLHRIFISNFECSPDEYRRRHLS
ncbi:MAG: hypothetical protein A2X49_15225 [Lentisphaerae bacterium GWF2_52_8]|nr:MAG: hypothetical protein A2X49_15225 [Lentisphaerae bacterium GWF2_52_8]